MLYIAAKIITAVVLIKPSSDDDYGVIYGIRSKT